MKSLILAQDER